MRAARVIAVLEEEWVRAEAQRLREVRVARRRGEAENWHLAEGPLNPAPPPKNPRLRFGSDFVAKQYSSSAPPRLRAKHPPKTPLRLCASARTKLLLNATPRTSPCA